MGKIKALTEKIRKKHKKLRRKFKRVNRQYLNRKTYFWYREHLPIEEKSILLETLNGQSPDGNINALLKELTSGEEYSGFKIYLSCRKTAIGLFHMPCSAICAIALARLTSVLGAF